MNDESPKIRHLRFKRVVFGVSSSPFLLNATIRHHLEKYKELHPHLVQLLLDSFYVDDMTTRASSDEEAYSLYAEAKQVLSDGGFNLRKFRTNSAPLQQRIDSTEGSKSTATTTAESYADLTFGASQLPGPQETKILGVRWNSHTDQFVFSACDVAQAAQAVEPTKRNVVSVIGRFYDPLGFLSPVILKFKLLFQKLCAHKMDWDRPLTGDLLTEWHTLVKELQVDIPVSIPRCYVGTTSSTITSTTLCGFCDASTTAYAAVVYLKVTTTSGTNVQFVVSKSRVPPTQELTIPRLELLSALLLSRLIAVVSANLKPILPINGLKCYTDSIVAFFWIRGTDKTWKPFVNNRVTEIRTHVPPEHWHHCAGVSNPADLPSRGLTLLELSVSQLWHQGPPWLSASDESQSAVPGELTMPEECEIEMNISKEKTFTLLGSIDPTLTVGTLIDCKSFS